MARTTVKPAQAPLEPPAKPPAESIKETIDSIIVALALALVFRAFVVEAFVIPTGSMAGTLLGEHREFVCPSCGYSFSVGIDRQQSTRADRPMSSDEQMQDTNRPIYCPSCGEKFDKDEQLLASNNPDRAGDKILVFKFPYLFDKPKRWDVVVFYNPAKPEDNFIKRMIGRPGETIQILDGDVYVGEATSVPNDPKGWEIARKPPEVQKALWRPVYLNDYLPVRVNRDKDAPRWAPAKDEGSGWTCNTRRLGFRPKAKNAEPDRILFRPDNLNLGFHDYYSYNRYPEPDRQFLFNVVWDLRLEGVVFFRDRGGTVSLSMNKRHGPPDSRQEDRFTAIIHQEGKVELWKDRPDTGRTRIGERQRPAGEFGLNKGVAVALQNVDYQAGVWVDDAPLIVTTDKQYGPPVTKLREMEKRRAGVLKVSDLPPQTPEEIPTVWIEATSGGPLELWHVNLLRDVYYTTRTNVSRRSADEIEILPVERGSPASPYKVHFVKDWASAAGTRFITGQGVIANTYEEYKEWTDAGAAVEDGAPIVRLKKRNRDRDDADDEFFVMGDNSPSSSDGRLWTIPAANGDNYWYLAKERIPRGAYRAGRVPRDHLIGRAFFVYWPSGLRILGSTFQFVPNVGRMRLIH